MTWNKIVQDLLCFKGIVNFNEYYVKLDFTDKLDNSGNWKVMLSILN